MFAVSSEDLSPTPWIHMVDERLCFSRVSSGLYMCTVVV